MSLRRPDVPAGQPSPARASSPVGEPEIKELPPPAEAMTLPIDWLPRALLVGDGLIAAVSVLAGYWLRFGSARQALPLGPYLLAIPVVVALYLIALAINRQYRSWRGLTLVDQVISTYSGIFLAAIL